MTHHTEAERAELLHALEESQSLLAAMLHESRPASEIQKQMEQNREAIDASRRAPAAPVPQGWKLVPIESTEKMQRAIAAQFCGTASEALAAWYEALAAAPQPPEEPLVPSIAVTPEMVEAANEAYCPFGDMELALCAALQVAPIPPGAAPVQLPDPVAEITFHSRKKPDVEWLVNSVVRGTKLYTEQQVRQLLAAHGIKEQST